MINEVTRRATKRVHNPKPKQALTQAEQDSLKTVLSEIILSYEEVRKEFKDLAKYYKKADNKEASETMYKNIKKAKVKIKKLSTIQYKLKRGLI